jgi:hypothetical protein
MTLMLPPADAHAQASGATAAAAQEAPALKDDKAKTSYAIGMNLGSAIRRDSSDLDVNLIVQGLKDAFSGAATLLTEAEMRGLLTRLQAELKTKQATRRGTSAAVPAGGASAATNLAGIDVSFKLDPRISKGLYMGDRWVAPPYTQGGDEKQVTVEARAQGLDRNGKSVNTRLRWVPADPEIAAVTPGEGGQVTITVQRPGETSLRVTSDGVSKELAIKAEKVGAALRVTISPKEKAH